MPNSGCETQPQAEGTSILSDWLTRKQLASELNVSVDTLARWRSKGSGPVCINVGNRSLYSRQAIEKWLRQMEERANGGHSIEG
ncbi:helix-turn-helix transcriptional regulator [Tritonibacter mobilis]|uniref:helix-turn-helix transcriptional regulator n=1 Tax=Tritonibacter mobilis TaxID=379347 RepID=UPI0039A49089